MSFDNFFTPGSRRTQIQGLIVRIRDDAVLAKTPDVEYARKRLDRYGDPGTVEVRPCTPQEAQIVEDGARPGSGTRAFPMAGPKRQTRTAKLTDDQVRDVRRRLADGEKPVEIARGFGVKLHVICGVKARRTYTEVH